MPLLTFCFKNPTLHLNKQEISSITERAAQLASISLAEAETASQTTADTKASHLASKTSQTLGIEQESDVTGDLASLSAESAKTAKVTKVVRKETTQKPVQHIHIQGVNNFNLCSSYKQNKYNNFTLN